jgi:hypothetical protein
MIAVIGVPRWALPVYGWPDNGLPEAGDGRACVAISDAAVCGVTLADWSGCDA